MRYSVIVLSLFLAISQALADDRHEPAFRIDEESARRFDPVLNIVEERFQAALKDLGPNPPYKETWRVAAKIFASKEVRVQLAQRGARLTDLPSIVYRWRKQYHHENVHPAFKHEELLPWRPFDVHGIGAMVAYFQTQQLKYEAEQLKQKLRNSLPAENPWDRELLDQARERLRLLREKALKDRN